MLVLDLAQLRNVTLNDEALMREVVSALMSAVSEQIQDLQRAMERGDFQACIQVAHSARGACGNVGAVSLAAVFSALEGQAAEGDLESCRSSVRELTVELEKLRREAEKI